MTHAEQIFRAVANLLGHNASAIFTREMVRRNLNLDSHTWMGSYTAIFQGMRDDQPGGAPDVPPQFRNVFSRISHGKYRLTPNGVALLAVI
jgi:hypothetical protein